MMHIAFLAGFVVLTISPMFFFSIRMLAVGPTVFVGLVLVGRWYWGIVITESEVVGPKAGALGRAHLQRQGIIPDERPTAFVSDGAHCLTNQFTDDRISLWGMDEGRRSHLFDMLGLPRSNSGTTR